MLRMCISWGSMQVHVCRICDPFEEDYKYQVAEYENQENQLGNKFQKDFGIFTLQHLVPSTQHDSKYHVEKSKNQRNFHLVSVQKNNLVRGSLPCWVNTKNIRVT